MSRTAVLATARRVLTQLVHDRRTVALLLVVPCALLALLAWVFVDAPQTFDRVGPALLGIFPLTTMFVVTSVAMLRERTSGTLERLLALPLSKADLLLGYALAFGAVALVQSALASALALGPLDLGVAGSPAAVVAVALLSALLGNALGLLASAFAATEFQAVQFLPAFVLPQLLLCGLFLPRELMPRALDLAAGALPLTYAVDGVQRAAAGGAGDRVLADALAVAAFGLAALALAAATLRRRTP